MSNSNSQVAHLWANQSKPGARSSNGNFWFEGTTLYSYQTPIAKVHPQAILVDCEGYSVTTRGKHKSALWRAIDYGGAFSVPSIGVRGGRDNRGNEIDHVENIAYLRKQFEDELTRCRDLSDYQHDRAKDFYDSLEDYCAAFNQPFPFPSGFFARAWQEVLATRAAREAKRNTPAAIAKRAKDKAARDRAAARKAEALAAKERERATEWLAGAGVHYHSPYGVPALLRVRGDVLETSQGATVPLDHAIRAFRFILACKDAGKAWEKNGHSLRVGDFQVDSIDTDGNIRAGCHIILWSEIERIARQLNLMEG